MIQRSQKDVRKCVRKLRYHTFQSQKFRNFWVPCGKPVKEKSHLWVFPKMDFFNIKLCRVTRTCPQFPFIIYNNVLTSKNTKINPEYDFPAGIGRSRFWKSFDCGTARIAKIMRRRRLMRFFHFFFMPPFFLQIKPGMLRDLQLEGKKAICHSYTTFS